MSGLVDLQLRLGINILGVQCMISEFSGLNFAGGDMVEVALSLDPIGATALNGATILFEMPRVMAYSRSG